MPGSRCPRCRASVAWTRTLRGKLLPLERTPLSRDDVPVEYRLRVAGGIVRRDEASRRAQIVRLSHFVVCPTLLKPQTLDRYWAEWPALAGLAERYGGPERYRGGVH